MKTNLSLILSDPGLGQWGLLHDSDTHFSPVITHLFRVRPLRQRYDF